MNKNELELYTFAVPKLELGDMQAGLESFDFIKKFLDKTLLAIDNIKNNLHIFNTLYRGEHINELKDLISIKNTIDKVIEKHEYLDVKNKEVNGVAGLISLTLAAEKLPILLDHVNENTLKVLESSVVLLDKFIADVDFRKSFMKSNDALGSKVWGKNINIETELTSFVDLNLVTDTVKIGQVIPNLYSLKIIHENLVAAGKKTQIFNLKKIEDTIELIVDRVKIIEGMMNNTEDSFTKQAISSVGDSLSDLGNMVRYHSLVYYVTAEVSKVAINIVKTLEKINK